MMTGHRLVFFLTMTNFVLSAPMPLTPGNQNNTNQQKGLSKVGQEVLDANVRELENLKQSIDKSLEMMKTQSRFNAYLNGHSDRLKLSKTETKINQNSKSLVAEVEKHADKEQPWPSVPERESHHVDVDIPKQNVQRLVSKRQQREEVKKGYEAVDEEISPRDVNRQAEKSQFSPMELAEYIFWTGDEKGVTLAVEEFLQAKLMTKEEAINFLQQIKLILDHLQQHYLTQLGLNGGADRSKNRMEDVAEDWENKKETIRQIQEFQGLTHNLVKDNYDLTDLKYEPVKKNFKILNNSNRLPTNYDNIIDRLRTADLFYNQYSLEEIIYQLAKIMFTQRLTRGSAEAKVALEKFTDFLQREADEGHISKTLEKQVLDILIASLTDTLNDYPEITSIREYFQDDNRRPALEQLVQMIQLDKTPHADNVQLSRNSRLGYDAMLKYRTIGQNALV